MSTLGGSVVDVDGRPVEGAVVVLGADSPPHQDIAAVTDGGGAFRFGSLGPGRYTVLARADGYELGEASADVDGAGHVTVVVRRS